MRLKQFGKNTALYALGNIVMRAGAFLLIPLYTHALSIGDYGLLATLLLTIQILLILANGGMRICLLRFSNEFKHRKRMGELLGTSSAVNLVGGIVITAILFAFFVSLFRTVLHVIDPYPYMVMVCGITILQSLTLHLMAYYRAENAVISFNIVGIVTVVLLLITNAVFLYTYNLGVMGALWASTITYACVLAYISYAIFSKTGVTISFSLFPELFDFGFPLIFSELALLLIGGVSVYFLSYYYGLETVAIYSLGSKLASVLVIAIILPFQLAFQPFVYSSFEKADFNEKMRSIITYLVLAIAITIFSVLFASRLLLPLIAPPEYSAAFLVILFLLPGTAFVGIYYIGETLLSAVKKTHLIGLMMTCFALLTLLFNYLLIPVMNWYGAVIASNICFILAGTTFLTLGKQYFVIPLEWRRIGMCVGLIFFFSILFLFLNKLSLVFFLPSSLVAALSVAALLFKVRFFKPDELAVIREVFIP